jgi:hypothetical protein
MFEAQSIEVQTHSPHNKENIKTTNQFLHILYTTQHKMRLFLKY